MIHQYAVGKHEGGCLLKGFKHFAGGTGLIVVVEESLVGFHAAAYIVFFHEVESLGCVRPVGPVLFVIVNRESCPSLAQGVEGGIDSGIGEVPHFVVALHSVDVACYQCFQLINKQVT